MSALKQTKLTSTGQALAVLRERIRTGYYPPLSRLPRETELASSLAVSRSALREAIRALELIGMLESRHGSGTYVTELRISDVVRDLGQDLHIDHKTAVELVDFRRAIEPVICAMAARNATDSDIKQIRDIFEQQERTTDAREYLKLDGQMHEAIARSVGNTILVSIMTSVAYGAAWSRMWELLLLDTIPERSRQDHALLVEAIETRDADLAMSVSHTHLANAQKQISTRISELEEDRGIEL